jgi:hypothetical protein
MKLLLFISGMLLGSASIFGQCSVTVNDSLYIDYSYVLNATNQVGQAPYQYTWTVTDGNGIPLQYVQNSSGDSITIASQTVQGAYGCIIYQLCMTDAVNCTTCSGDTSELQVPFACYSAFESEMVGPNQIAITMYNDIPPFLIQQQFMQWTDGNGDGQGMPYMGPGTVLTYTPGPQNLNDKFLLCVMSLLNTGGCLSCDSIPYSMLGLTTVDELEFTIYPNPATEVIQLNSSRAMDHIQVLGLNGTVLQQKEVHSVFTQELQVAELPNGIYLLHVVTADGILVKKISIHR